MALQPLWYERKGDKVNLAIQVTNTGMSAVSNVVQTANLTADGKIAANDKPIHSYVPHFEIGENSVDAHLVQSAAVSEA